MFNNLNNIKISIIMAVYNCGETIVEAIESVLSQTHENWEIIICDDCSIDNTHDILLGYKQKYPDKFIILKNERNSKLPYSLNHCLRHASGDYIARMDGDDISLPERLEKQLKFILENPIYDVVGTSMIPFDKNGDRSPRNCKKCPNKFDLIKNSCFNHATILMKKNAYDSLNGYTELPRTTRGQDYDLWFRFFAAGFNGYNIQEPLYKVRESLDDFKRRTFKVELYSVQTRLIGYKLLNYPLRYYIFAFKPIVVALIPNRIMYLYHNWKVAGNL